MCKYKISFKLSFIKVNNHNKLIISRFLFDNNTWSHSFCFLLSLIFGYPDFLFLFARLYLDFDWFYRRKMIVGTRKQTKLTENLSNLEFTRQYFFFVNIKIKFNYKMSNNYVNRKTFTEIEKKNWIKKVGIRKSIKKTHKTHK